LGDSPTSHMKIVLNFPHVPAFKHFGTVLPCVSPVHTFALIWGSENGDLVHDDFQPKVDVTHFCLCLFRASPSDSTLLPVEPADGLQFSDSPAWDRGSVRTWNVGSSGTHILMFRRRPRSKNRVSTLDLLIFHVQSLPQRHSLHHLQLPGDLDLDGLDYFANSRARCMLDDYLGVLYLMIDHDIRIISYA
jgi:hypothetical protein